MLVHGYPRPDASIAGRVLVRYARAYVSRWRRFADQTRRVLLAPAFGSGDWQGFRVLAGARLPADTYLTSMVQEMGESVGGFDGRFWLYGHSAGAQFAARYLVAHGDKLDRVVLSAPGTYPYPLADAKWPFGMADPEDGSAPDLSCWLRAASETSTTIVIGANDTEKRPDEVAQQGRTRLARAQNWCASMNALAADHGRTGRVAMEIVARAGHGAEELTPVAQSALSATRIGDGDTLRP